MDGYDAISRTARSHASVIRRPYGRCLEVSDNLARDLNAQGIPARVLRCSDGAIDAPHADARLRNLSRAPASWVHYVVQTDDYIIDLTRRQFDPDAAQPHYCDARSLAAEWRTIEPAVQPESPAT